MKLGEKNKYKSKICDRNNQTGFILFGRVGGWEQFGKSEKMRYLQLTNG